MDKHPVLVARDVFPEVIARLAEHFTLELNPDDTVWPPAELARRLRDKVGAFTTGSERIDAALLAQCPRLRICANMAVGHNNFDLDAMGAAGVLATNAPGVLPETTADLAFTVLMAAARRVSESEAYLRAGRWTRWSYDMFMGPDVHGATLGVLGMGRIGQAIARRGALGFGMPVIYHNRSRLPADVESALGARYVGPDELFAQADHLVLVLPYSAQSHHIVGARQLAQMKPSATLTNIGRGGLVDEDALADALAAGRLHAAGLDVFEGEPRVNPRLLALHNVVLTPHIGSASVKTRLAMGHLAADNLIGYLVHGQAATPLNLDQIRP